MDADIVLILVQDGVVNGAIYALLALALVLVFAVTRVIYVASGELVAYAALAYAQLDTGHAPTAIWLLLALGAGAFLLDLRRGRPTLANTLSTLALPVAIVAITLAVAPLKPGPLAEALLAIAIVTPMSPYLYRIAFQPLASASVLVLLIAAVGLHLALTGLGLVFFGPEGYRAPAFAETGLQAGPISLPGQALCILAATAALMLGLYAFFDRSLTGKALRATAINSLGARLVGIPTEQAGSIAFTLAGLVCAISGVLIVPLSTTYYDSGFMIGLKGFTAAIIGGLGSYPGAVLAAIAVGIGESFSSFWASSLKEVIVFASILPILLYRSLRHGPAEEDE